MRRLSLSVLGMLAFVWASGSTLGQQPSAEKLMEQMASAYASCRSYLDEGEVRTVFLEQNGRRTTIKPFSTAFEEELSVDLHTSDFGRSWSAAKMRREI